MKFAGITIIVVLTAALAVAVGWVIFHIGRIVISIVREARAPRRPSRQMQHPELGTLTFESGLWRGGVTRNGMTIPFTVAGTEAAPDGVLINKVSDIVRRFRMIETEGLNFLRAECPEVRAARFTFHGLELLSAGEPGDFSLEWLADGDDSRVWRVNFKADQPKEAGFDD